MPPIRSFFFFFFFFYLIVFIVSKVQELACSLSYGVNKTTKITNKNKQNKKQYPHPPLLP